MTGDLPVAVPAADVAPLPPGRLPAVHLPTAEACRRLAALPPEVEWFANLGCVATRRVYANALQDFRRSTGMATPEEFRTVTRAHGIALREDRVQRTR